METPNIPLCHICGQPMNLKPAGISRNTGKPYNAFWACPTRHDRPQSPQTQNLPPQGGFGPQVDIDQFLTKNQFNEQLDKMRLAFKEMMDSIKEHDKEIADLTSRMAVVESPTLRIPCEKDEIMEEAKKVFG